MELPNPLPNDVKSWAKQLLLDGKRLPSFEKLDAVELLWLVESPTSPVWIVHRAQYEIQKRLQPED
jgi:hypothetical protein